MDTRIDLSSDAAPSLTSEQARRRLTLRLRERMAAQRPGGASRYWAVGAFLLILAAVSAEGFGRIIFDTKIDLAIRPDHMISSLLQLWDPRGWGGTIRDQYP